MADITAEQLARRIFECRLMEQKAIDRVLGDAGGRGVATLEQFISELQKHGHLTNWQTTRLCDGHVRGYFYGNWKVLYMVGAGTFARVYRGVHQLSGDVKAIKVLRNRYGNDDDTRDRFMREAKMVMRLRHPNIVPIHEVETDRGRIYMVMDFVEGQNLRDYVKAHKKIPTMTALRILRDLASGLTYATKQGVMHRDMKLSNVLLSSSGQAKLVDFGLATINKEKLDKGDEGSEFNPRSIDYAGLERATGVRRDDERSDIFFLGCMLYHMITGVPPLFETRERIKRLSSHRYKNIPPITNLEPDLPHRVVILCHRLMEPNAEKRVQTPEQALGEIEGVIKAVESGDVKKYDQQLSKQHAEEYEKLVQQTQDEGIGKTILIIESNAKVQNALRENLKNLGYRVLIVGDPQRGLARFQDLDPAEDCPADCVIFGCTDLGISAIESFNAFGSMEYSKDIPAILLLTERQQKYMNQARLADHRVHIPLPIKFKNVRRTLRKLLNIADPPDDVGAAVLKA